MKQYLSLFCGITALVSCQSDQPKPDSNSAPPALQPNMPIITSAVRLSPCLVSEKEALYPTASLSEWTYKSARLQTTVAEFPLGSPSPDEQKQPAALNPKANHIHWNINNKQHIITNTPEVETTLPDGQYPLVGFLVRSYNTIVRNNDSYIMDSVEVKNGKIISRKKISQPMLAYSSPLGLFRNEEGNKIVLDFLLMNSSIAPNGNRVRAVLNATDTFLIDKASPYYIEGLGLGEHTLQLELLDAKGLPIIAPVSGKFIVNEEKEKS